MKFLNYSFKLSLINFLPSFIKRAVPQTVKRAMLNYILRPRVLRKIDSGKPIGDVYYGDVAQSYELSRNTSDFWVEENLILASQLKKLIKLYGLKTVIDLPVGTGRFIDVYHELNIKFFGVDLSREMLDVAEPKLLALQLSPDVLFCGTIDDIRAGSEFDVWVCFRFLQGIISFNDAVRHIRLMSFKVRYAILELGVGYQDKENVYGDDPMLYRLSDVNVESLLFDCGFDVTERSIPLAACAEGYTCIYTLKSKRF